MNKTGKENHTQLWDLRKIKCFDFGFLIFQMGVKINLHIELGLWGYLR